MRAALSLLMALTLQAQVTPRPPEGASGRRVVAPTRARTHMVAAAHPEAARAGLEILEAGGSAADAAIAAQLALGVVEPQSSGLGGGTLALVWDPRSRSADFIDGRETAPAAARPERFLGVDGTPQPEAELIPSGLSVGVPGTLRALALLHARHGRLPWARLVRPALRLCERGFRVTPRLHHLLAVDPWLRRTPAARTHFYDATGQAWPVGHRLRNPAQAALLRRIAREGEAAFYEGPVARALVAAVAGDPRPGDLTLADLAAYRPVRREPLAFSWLGHRILTAPPEAGGLFLAQLLGLLEPLDLPRLAPDGAEARHLLCAAGRLAFADRERWLADPAFAPVPVGALLAPDYLALRRALIDPARDTGTAAPGLPEAPPPGQTPEVSGTTHLSVVDRWGGAVAMTSTIESAFGSGLFVEGILLNNELTDFSQVPEAGGRPVANRVQPGKRPRSAMSPTLVFNPDGSLRLVAGSPGSSAIIPYVAEALIRVLAWGQDPQAAVDAPHALNRNGATEVEEGPWAPALKAALEARGHRVVVGPLTSGLHLVERRGDLLRGGADPRREGVALGR